MLLTQNLYPPGHIDSKQLIALNLCVCVFVCVHDGKREEEKVQLTMLENKLELPFDGEKVRKTAIPPH